MHVSRRHGVDTLSLSGHIVILLLSAQALSGVFLAEQIRQQQLASELHNHLQNSNSSLTAMQALLSLGNSVNGESAHKKVSF